jgi:hypothetical protein
MVLNQRHVTISPFGFEDDILAALAAHEIDAAAVTPLSVGYYNLTHPGTASNFGAAAGRTVARLARRGAGRPSWLRYCNVTFSPGRISQMGGPHGGAPRDPMADGLHGGGAPHFARVDRMAAAGLTRPRCASERGLAMGGGRPAQRRFTVGGSGKSVARCHRTVLAYWKFESISLQRRVMRTFGP